jgi:Protein of Unknown function (DUF2784)
MAYRILADFVVVVHLSFVLFVVLGGLLVLRWRAVMRLHLPAAVWGVLIEFAGWMCPLTLLENWLRHMDTEAGYRGSFVEHYFLWILYPESLTRNLQIALGCMALIVNLAIYWRVLSRTPRAPES